MRHRASALLFCLIVAASAQSQQPTFTASATPHPLTLQSGGPAQSVTVATQADGFVGSTITYSFSGFPASIQNDGPKTTNFDQVGNSLYPPVTFTFAAAPGTPGGTYTGTLTGMASGGQTRTFPFTIVVQQPDITVSVTQPQMSMCAGGPPQSNSVRIDPVNGYQGTPQVTFVNIPAGVAVSPNPLPAQPLPPGRTLPFEVAATAPGNHAITVRVTDPQFGIDRTTTFFVQVTAPDFTAAVQPPQVNLTAGGPAAPVVASLTSTTCMNENVTVTASAPQGIVVTPQAQTLVPPSYGAVPFSIQASPNAAAGTYPVTFTFAGSGGAPTRIVTINVNVSLAPDFVLSVAPQNVRVPIGSSGSVTVTLQGLNGFGGAVAIQMPQLPGVTFNPPSFTMTPGSQVVGITVGAGAVPGSYALTVTGTGPDGSTRSAQFVLEIPQPDFALRAMPPVLTIAGGSSGAVDLTVEAMQGFAGTVTVATTVTSGIVATPAAFTMTASAPQRVTITVPRSVSPGQYQVTFTGTSPSAPQSRSTTVTINVTPAPDYELTVVPRSITVVQGTSSTVTVSAVPSNGFAETVAVTVQNPGGVTVTPSTFSLAPGGSQSVTISAPADAAPRVLEVRFTGVTPFGVVRSVDLQVTIAPVAPVITSIDPPAVTTGVRAVVVRLTGLNFRPGAVVTSRTPGVIVERTEVLSSSAAAVTLSVRADAQPGPYVLELRNPQGGVTAQGATLLVYPRESIGAPLGVTAAAIVFPRSGTFVAADEAVYARGLLATTGSGTIIGEWRLDGAAFDLFTAVVSGGMPTEVRSHAPIPPRAAGASRLELVVTSPQLAVSPAVTVVHTIDTASRLELYEPRDGSVVVRSAAAPLFRWSLVPGASGYEVEVFESDAVTAIRFRTSVAEWQPGAAALAQIGSGIRRWRVRPVFPGEVRGEPAQWQRFVVLPERLTLQLEAVAFDERGGASVRWSGGAPGVIYRVEFVDPESGSVRMTALSLQPSYRVPRALAAGLRGSDVRIVAVTPDGTVLAVTPVRRLARGRASEIFRAQAAPMPAITRQEPAEGGRVTTDRPRISAAWDAAVPADQVALIVGTTDVTAVSTVTPTSITYDALLPLAAGSHTVRVAAGDLASSWTFTVADAAEAGAAGTTPAPTEAPTQPGTPAAPAAGSTSTPLRRDWALTPMATVAVRSGEEQDSAAVQVSTQADVGRDALSSKVAGDLSFRKPLEGDGDIVQESQNWLGTIGARQGSFREQLTAGYVVPDFLDQTQFLTLGTARGGIGGKLATRGGTFSAFHSFESSITGVVAGSFAPVQDVRAYAYEAPTNTQRLLVRAIALRIEEEGSLYSSGGEGESVGVFARYALTPMMNIVAEAARGSFTARGLGQRERAGNALRVGLSGTRRTLGWQLNLRRTEADYVNPANRGFTWGSVADRQGGDLSVTAMLGRASVSVTARHLESGRSSDSTSAHGVEDGLTATFSSMFGRIFNVSASVNLTADETDADTARGLPAVDRRVGGAQLTFGQMLGRLNFSQTLQYNRTDSRVGPFGDAVIRGATFTATGALSSFANISAFLSAMRSESVPEAGVNDQLVLTIQPSLVIAPYSVSLQPVLSYSRMQNDRLNLETSTQSFTPTLTWTPQWLRQAIAVQVSGGWRRTETAGQPASQPDPTYAATLSLRWPLRSGAVSQPGGVLPGATPIAPPEQGSANPVQSATTPPPATN